MNATYKKHIRAAPRELFAVERLHLKLLPAWIPEVYRLHQRLVDIEGYVALHTNRYSVPMEWIGRRVEVRETKGKIAIQLDSRRSALRLKPYKALGHLLRNLKVVKVSAHFVERAAI